MRLGVVFVMAGIMVAAAARADGPAEAPLPERAAAAGPEVRTSQNAAPIVKRGLSRSLIERTKRIYRADATSCLDYAVRRNPEAEGRATISVRIDASGRVLSANLLEYGDRRFASCLEHSVLAWRFPESDATTSTVLSFTFSSSLQ